MSTNSAAIRVGRLLEIRVDGGYRTLADVDQVFDAIQREIRKLHKAKHVAVVDWRRCPLMSPTAAGRVAQRIAQLNAHTQRSAALANHDSPVAVLQFLRVIRETGLADRKLFFEARELVDWLAGALTDAELRRLAEFLGEGSS
jgi:hypothetical protein